METAYNNWALIMLVITVPTTVMFLIHLWNVQLKKIRGKQERQDTWRELSDSPYYGRETKVINSCCGVMRNRCKNKDGYYYATIKIAANIFSPSLLEEFLTHNCGLEDVAVTSWRYTTRQQTVVQAKFRFTGIDYSKLRD